MAGRIAMAQRHCVVGIQEMKIEGEEVGGQVQAHGVPGPLPLNETMATATGRRFRSRRKHLVNEAGSSRLYGKSEAGCD